MVLRIHIIDDHKIVLQGIHNMLSQHLPQCTFCLSQSGAEAIEAERGGSSDVIILDYEMPQMLCIEIIQAIRRFGSKAGIIVYTMHEEYWVINELLNCGVAGVVFKAEEPLELVEAVRAVSLGQTYFSSRFTQARALGNGQVPVLSERERQILQLIGEGYSSREIAGMVFISENTVEYHRKNLLKALGAKNKAHLVMKAIEYNLIKPQKH